MGGYLLRMFAVAQALAAVVLAVPAHASQNVLAAGAGVMQRAVAARIARDLAEVFWAEVRELLGGRPTIRVCPAGSFSHPAKRPPRQAEPQEEQDQSEPAVPPQSPHGRSLRRIASRNSPTGAPPDDVAPTVAYLGRQMARSRRTPDGML